MKKYGLRILIILLVVGAAVGLLIKRKHDLALGASRRGSAGGG